VDPAPEARANAQALDLPLCSSIDDVLSDTGISGVVIATPHSLHRVQVIAAARAGKHVFCEKPLALNVADASAMLDACRRAGVRLAVGHNRRFWPAMKALKETVTAGRLGRLLHIEGHNSNENSNRVTGGWRASADESPGGGFTGAGLHVLDALIHLFGPARRVYAQLRLYREELPPLDAMSAIYEFASGMSGFLATVRATPFYWRVQVFGSLGSAEVLGETELILRLSGQEAQTIACESTDSVREELEAFVQAAEGGAEYPVRDGEVLATLAAFEATLASLRTGQPVALQP